MANQTECESVTLRSEAARDSVSDAREAGPGRRSAASVRAPEHACRKQRNKLQRRVSSMCVNLKWQSRHTGDFQ